MMKKLLKNVLSLALVLALVLSLGVTAFADGTDAKDEEEDEVEIIDIAFNLCTGEPCAVRMRELGYDDIRLNGISYKADAKDGVIAIHLGDLAAAKLLTEKKDEAEKAGIDFDKIYIRNGKVCVDGDSALSATVNSFMTANKLNVSIGDIFELSNGSELKLKVRVVNFYYPAQCTEPETLKLAVGKLAQDVVTSGKVETPPVTTVYLYYEGTQSYKDTKEKNDDGNTIVERFLNNITKLGVIGIAKEKNDKNDYYIQGFSKTNTTGSAWTKMQDLSEDGGLDKWLFETADGSKTNEAAYFVDEWVWNIGDSHYEGGIDEPLTKVVISKDTNGTKETFKEFTFEDKTDVGLDDLLKVQNDKDALAKLGYTVDTDEYGYLVFSPINSVVITEVDENSYSVVYMDTFKLATVDNTEATPTTFALTAPAAPVAVAVDAAPVEDDAETEEPAAEPAEEPAEEVIEEEPAEEVKDEEAVEEPEEVKEEAAEVTEGTTDAAPAETPTLTQAELDEIERKKKLAEEEAAARLAATNESQTPTETPTETAAVIPADGE